MICNGFPEAVQALLGSLRLTRAVRPYAHEGNVGMAQPDEVFRSYAGRADVVDSNQGAPRNGGPDSHEGKVQPVEHLQLCLVNGDVERDDAVNAFEQHRL